METMDTLVKYLQLYNSSYEVLGRTARRMLRVRASNGYALSPAEQVPKVRAKITSNSAPSESVCSESVCLFNASSDSAASGTIMEG